MRPGNPCPTSNRYRMEFPRPQERQLIELFASVVLAKLTGPDRTASACAIPERRCFVLLSQDGGLTMHIARAYCVEAESIVDIYKARALFFAGDEPRVRFEFLCSDELCRASNATKVIGVNYDKLVEEGDCFVQKPHFRTNAGCVHIDSCEWVAREREIRRLEAPPARSPCRGFRRLKADDLVGVFWPDPSAAPGPTDTGPIVARSPSPNHRGILSNDSRPQRTYTLNRTTVDFLETVISAYELLDSDERHEAQLRIGSGPTFSYSKAFCRIQYYLGIFGPRIFHGGVRVEVHGPNYAVRFFDRIRPYPAGSSSPRSVSLYLKRDQLRSHWNGRFLAAQLAEATKPAHYAHCYFFGRLVPHPTHHDRLAVELQTLNHLAFTVRAVRTIPRQRATG